MFKHLLTFGFLLASVLSVYCGDAMQTTQPDNKALQDQSDVSTQYPMPYSSEIRHTMFDGKEIYIEGAILLNPKSLTVELCETRTCLQDIEMWADYQFTSQKFSMKYKRNLMWGPAAIYEGKQLEGGKDVKITVVIDSHQFKVIVNSETFVLNETARMTKIKYIHIRGNVIIDWILYSPKRIDFKVNPLGEKIVVNGFPTHNTGRFYVYLACSGFLQTGTTMDDVADVALDFDVRFTGYTSPKSVIINHRTEGNWGPEHIYPNHTFLANITFQLEITLLPGSIKIDHKNVREYHFRHAIDEIQYFGYVGNVLISQILTT